MEQSLTLVAAYSTYLIIEDLGGSGVIGVVTTSLILGNFGSRIGMNPRTRIIVSEFWEFLAFFVNSIMFLLIGDQVHFSTLGDNIVIIGVTVTAMILTRAIAIYTLSSISNYFVKPEIGLSEQTILWWGGLRGSVSIALALSVPVALPERDKIIATVFGVVLFTLLFQGLTIKPLVQKLKLTGDQPLRQQYMEFVARQVALERVLQHLKTNQRPGIDPEFYRYQEALIKGGIEDIQLEINQLEQEYPNLQSFITDQLRGELLAIEANTYAEFVKAGRLNKELSPFLSELLHTGNEKVG